MPIFVKNAKLLPALNLIARMIDGPENVSESSIDTYSEQRSAQSPNGITSYDVLISEIIANPENEMDIHAFALEVRDFLLDRDFYYITDPQQLVNLFFELANTKTNDYNDETLFSAVLESLCEELKPAQQYRIVTNFIDRLNDSSMAHLTEAEKFCSELKVIVKNIINTIIEADDLLGLHLIYEHNDPTIYLDAATLQVQMKNKFGKPQPISDLLCSFQEDPVFPQVSILASVDTNQTIVKRAIELLSELKISFELDVVTTDLMGNLGQYSDGATKRGVSVFMVFASDDTILMAKMLEQNTTLPVLMRTDSVSSHVLQAARILSIHDAEIKDRLVDYQARMNALAADKAQRLKGITNDTNSSMFGYGIHRKRSNEEATAAMVNPNIYAAGTVAKRVKPNERPNYNA